jgi:uncharacterized protein involved in exopolysaccharide biosynthesis
VLPSVIPYSLQEFFEILRDRWIVVFGFAIVAVAAALAFSLTSTKQYDATAKLLLLQTDQAENLLNPGSSSVVDPARNVATSEDLVKLDSVARRVRDQLGIQRSTQDLLAEVHTTSGTSSDVVSVTVRDPDPDLAARLANGFATQYVLLRSNTDKASLSRAAANARAQLATLSPTQKASAEGQDLTARLRQLQLAASSVTGGVELVSHATVPSSPSRPRPLLTGVLALLLGLTLGVIAALLIEAASPGPTYGSAVAQRQPSEDPVSAESETR